jgi:hypothetical protein
MADLFGNSRRRTAEYNRDRNKNSDRDRDKDNSDRNKKRQRHRQSGREPETDRNKKILEGLSRGCLVASACIDV